MPATSAGPGLRALPRPPRLDRFRTAVSDRRVNRRPRHGCLALSRRPAEQRRAAQLAHRLSVEQQLAAALALARHIPRAVPLALALVIGRVRLAAHERHRRERWPRRHLHRVLSSTIFADCFRPAATLPVLIVQALSWFPDYRPRQHKQPHHHAPHSYCPALSFLFGLLMTDRASVCCWKG